MTEFITGSETVGATEWSLMADNSYDSGDASTSAGIYQLFLDVSAIASGDEFQVRVYEKVRAGDTQRVIEEWNLAYAQPKPIFVTPALMLINGWDFTIKRITGTDRIINWSIRKG